MSPSRVVLVGCGPLARATADDLLTRRRVRVLGAFALPGSQGSMPVPVLGDIADLQAYLSCTAVDEVYVAAYEDRHRCTLQGVIDLCERLGIPFATPAQSYRFSRALPQDDTAAADGYLHYRTHPQPAGGDSLKRVFDIVSSALALVVLSPLLAAIAVAVAVSSPGPVLFRQARVGLRGRPFTLYKFRSMVADAEARQRELLALNEQDGPAFKIRRDPRVTGVGRVLRRHSLDELPQLLNVLRGDMSIVGPRPPLPHEVAKYQPWMRRRMSVRPGLTCFWQVEGRNDLSFEQWMHLDLRYIDHPSFLTDLGIILRTLPAVLSGQGAS